MEVSDIFRNLRRGGFIFLKPRGGSMKFAQNTINVIVVQKQRSDLPDSNQRPKDDLLWIANSQLQSSALPTELRSVCFNT